MCPTFQNTLHDWAERIMLTLPVAPVISVPVPSAVWKMKTASGSLAASSVSVPVIPNVPDAEV